MLVVVACALIPLRNKAGKQPLTFAACAEGKPMTAAQQRQARRAAKAGRRPLCKPVLSVASRWLHSDWTRQVCGVSSVC
jgi:hypothetical protein